MLIHGIDPGVVDTGIVSLYLDFAHRQMSIEGRVWRNISVGRGLKTQVKRTVLDHISDVVSDGDVFIEGYRNRGRNMLQDQQMGLIIA